MTNKEYRKNYQGFNSFDFWDSLNQYETAALRRDVKTRAGVPLEGTNWKASVRRDNDGLTLTSYYTDVLRILDNGQLVRLWDGYSATTARHINKLMDRLSLPRLSKREWYELPTA